uniref:Peptidase S1 domain-containing protein n=1 Tax=Anopheles farauti TaxID=69004 RepID=A0A182Q9D0_9DIPT
MRTGERISTQKCREYTNAIATQYAIINLIPYPERKTFEVYNCSHVLTLIVGGTHAREGEFPHQALLGYRLPEKPMEYVFACGGSLISEWHVLTAAHCFRDLDPEVVVLGEHDKSVKSYKEWEIGIDRIRRHPLYPRNQPYFDIALIRLEQGVSPSQLIRPACLWTSEDRPTKKFVASGFGRTDHFREQLSDVLMKVDLDEFPATTCSTQYQSKKQLRHGLDESHLCVGSVGTGKDTCLGDSGGPLQLLTNQTTCTYHLVGITSLGQLCGTEKAYGVYTKVSYYLDWIEDNVWGANAL